MNIYHSRQLTQLARNQKLGVYLDLSWVLGQPMEYIVFCEGELNRFKTYNEGMKRFEELTRDESPTHPLTLSVLTDCYEDSPEVDAKMQAYWGKLEEEATIAATEADHLMNDRDRETFIDSFIKRRVEQRYE
jgi:hypothetical protein